MGSFSRVTKQFALDGFKVLPLQISEKCLQRLFIIYNYYLNYLLLLFKFFIIYLFNVEMIKKL